MSSWPQSEALSSSGLFDGCFFELSVWAETDVYLWRSRELLGRSFYRGREGTGQSSYSR